jgi:hypothetical protein
MSSIYLSLKYGSVHLKLEGEFPLKPSIIYVAYILLKIICKVLSLTELARRYFPGLNRPVC